MKTLVVVDVQRDFFCPEGSLYVPGSEVLPEKILEIFPEYDAIVLTLDWHPGNHCSFKENGGIWPPHCISYTQGAGLPDIFGPAVAERGNVFYCLKGKDKGVEEYGAFEDMVQGDRFSELFMKSDEIDVCGIVGEYCVQESIANLIKHGFADKVVALTDLTAYFDGGVAFGKYLDDNHIISKQVLSQ